VAYHADAVPVEDNENKRTRNASVSANSPNCPKNWPMCSHVFFPWSPENFAPRHHAYSELISERPAIFSLTISMAASARPPALWSNICGVG
jgi:hypothetical protein